MRGWVIYNPYAGRFPAQALVERAVRPLRDAGWEISICQTAGPEHASRLAANCAAAGCSALFVAGGDGTVGQAAKGLVGTGTALGVLPAGTANVFAQELGLARLGYTDWFALEESARALAAGRVATMDAGRCNGHVFLLWAGVGLDGHVVSRIEPRPRIAKHFAVPYYAAAVLWAARSWHGLDVHIRVDREEVSGRFVQVLVSNIQTYGGGLFQLADQARVDDGLLDVWTFAGDSFYDTLQHVWRLARSGHLNHPRVKGLTGQKITLEAAAPVRWQLDGEGYPPAQRFDMEVCPGALKVLVPETLHRPLFSLPDRGRLPTGAGSPEPGTDRLSVSHWQTPGFLDKPGSCQRFQELR